MKAKDRNTADCGRETAADDVSRLRNFLVAATVYAKQVVSLLHKAVVDAPMHSELIASLTKVINKCKENILPHILNAAIRDHFLFWCLIDYAVLRRLVGILY